MSRIKSWNPIVEKFQSKLSHWKATALSFGGRLTLIKSVLSNLPTYYLSLFRAPIGVINLLEKIRRRFLWGGDDTKNKISWVSWEKVVASKENGGVGLGSLKNFNISLLVKWWWRWKTSPDATWCKVIREIHNNGGKPLDHLAKKGLPGVWLEIAKLKDELEEIGVPIHSIFKTEVKSGQKTLFWTDNWCGDVPFKRLFPELYKLESKKSISVNKRLNAAGPIWAWKRKPRSTPEIKELSDLEALMSSIHLHQGEDRFCFKLDHNGLFSVGVLRWNLENVNSGSNTDCFTWNNIVPLKVACLAWRVWLNRLPTMDALITRGIRVQSKSCHLCGVHDESADHLFVQCSISKQIICWVMNWCKVKPMVFTGVSEFIKFCSEWKANKNQKKIFLAICYGALWNIWRTRNEMIFQKRTKSASSIMDEIIAEVFTWLKFRSGTKCKLNWVDWCASPLGIQL